MVPEEKVLLGRFPKESHPFNSATWDVMRGSRAIAQPNVPNSEANVVDRLGRSQESASFIYLREKKVFSPTTLFWIREPGQLAAVNAEKAIMREILDLNVRFDNYGEWACWQMLKGKLPVVYPDGSSVTIDYKLAASHQPAPAVSWATATPTQIVNDVRGWKRLVRRDSDVMADEAFATEVTVQHIFDSFAVNSGGVGSLLSDRMRDAYYSTGELPGFMGLKWNIMEAVYDATGAAYTTAPTDPGQETLFLPDNALILGNFTAHNPFTILEGPTADTKAPRNFTGKFAKTWEEEDPSDMQYLLEWNFVPIAQRAEQWIYVDSVISTIAGDG